MRDNALQMGHLIDDLLAFSRLGRKPLSRQQVATGTLVEKIVEQVKKQVEGRSVNVSVGEMPGAWADPALLNQVFFNLIDNAFKYTRRRAQAVVEIGSREIGSERVFFVRDNGAGFNMEYADKLFGVFQRLHRAEDLRAPALAWQLRSASSCVTAGASGLKRRLIGEPHSTLQQETNHDARSAGRNSAGRRQPERRHAHAARLQDRQSCQYHSCRTPTVWRH